MSKHWRPGTDTVLDSQAVGYPRESLADVPPGTYTVQALLHRYETFTRADGHTVKLPMDRGEGQQWNRAPGNLYSAPKRITISPSRRETVTLALDSKIPPIPDPPDTKYIKHVRIQSERLTKFWGRPMFLGAHVLLPEGFDAHPDARYPLVDLSRSLSVHVRRFSRRASRFDPEVRIQRAVPSRVLQPDRTAVRASVLQGLDRPGLSTIPDHRDPARQSVLRRLVRGELGERRALRRRDHLRADSRDREAVSRAR